MLPSPLLKTHAHKVIALMKTWMEAPCEIRIECPSLIATAKHFGLEKKFSDLVRSVIFRQCSCTFQGNFSCLNSAFSAFDAQIASGQ